MAVPATSTSSRLALGLAAAVLSSGVVLSSAPAASATTVATVGAPVHSIDADPRGAQARRQAAITGAAVRVALRQRGDRYRYGAAGPDAFDCSGLVQFAFHRAGGVLPRTSGEQARATKPIPRSRARRGDLVFFSEDRAVYHVGIYLGDDRLLHAPGTGERVQTGHLWTRRVSFGRVR
jgi:cell wall-associated NlpC family hydrolase